MKALLLIFILVPILEMVVLIKVGGAIGALSTVFMVFATAAIGLALLRKQGPSTLLKAQQKMQTGQLPAKEIVEGIFLAVGGALLLTPGFITDTLGFCCLIPGIRHVIIVWGGGWIFSRLRVRSVNTRENHFGGSDSISGKTIEGEFQREDKK